MIKQALKFRERNIPKNKSQRLETLSTQNPYYMTCLNPHCTMFMKHINRHPTLPSYICQECDNSYVDANYIIFTRCMVVIDAISKGKNTNKHLMMALNLKSYSVVQLRNRILLGWDYWTRVIHKALSYDREVIVRMWVNTRWKRARRNEYGKTRNIR